MRRVVPVALAVGVVAAIGLAPEAAQARDYPFCIKGGSYATPVGDCAFDTYQQCLATASGRKAYCDVNPYWPHAETLVLYPETPSAYPGKRHRRY
jgi:hypothetical protein